MKIHFQKIIEIGFVTNRNKIILTEVLLSRKESSFFQSKNVKKEEVATRKYFKDFHFVLSCLVKTQRYN